MTWTRRARASRHMQARGSIAPRSFYSSETWEQFSQNLVQVKNDDDEARLQELNHRKAKSLWTQADAQAFNDIHLRIEERQDAARAPFQMEIESRYHELNFTPLLPPLPKPSAWLDFNRPRHYAVTEVRPFLIACEQGSINEVMQWATEKGETLQHIGLQDGLACAAENNQVEIVRYLLQEKLASLDASVVQGACSNRSLPLFEICIQHGYHPNQQVPSRGGHFGVALHHCIDNEDITRFLLEHGADPDLAPFQDTRRMPWDYRATPPMDRECGLALDRAVKEGSLEVVSMLLDYGANINFARPLHSLIDRRWQGKPYVENDWRPLLELLLQHGVNVNANTRYRGTPVLCAVSHKMWDIAKLLLEHGADPRVKNRIQGGDAFAMAAKRAGVAWEPAEAFDEYLGHLTNTSSTSCTGDTVSPPNEVLQNPLVGI
ncbi:ankyrin repeat-containing domain protein [Xylariaceae sp. FL1651]|nr:ankyrin repeat-containing domain protein [Xylariaceae sp. FL1651]